MRTNFVAWAQVSHKPRKKIYKNYKSQVQLRTVFLVRSCLARRWMGYRILAGLSWWFTNTLSLLPRSSTLLPPSRSRKNPKTLSEIPYAMLTPNVFRFICIISWFPGMLVCSITNKHIYFNHKYLNDFGLWMLTIFL